MSFATSRIICILAALTLQNVWGVRRTISEESLELKQSPMGYAQGDTFEGFKLESHLDNKPIGKDLYRGHAASFLEHNATDKKKALVPFPSNMAEDYGSPKLLGAGSFGEAWLATGQAGTNFEGQRVVVKLLYIKEGRKHVHVTRAMTDKNAILKREVAGAASECNFAIRLQKAAPDMGEYGQFAQRLMGCYAHNFKRATGKRVPIFLVLENCGNDDLAKFIQTNKETLTSEQIASVMRQISEGLLYLSKMTPPVIHHDLKPANVVVKENDSGFPTVHLIDFGGMMNGETRLQTKRGTVATMVFAPPEWFSGYAFKMPPSSFDMYAVGNTLADMAFGDTFSGLFFDERKEMPNWRDLHGLSEDPSRISFVSQFAGLATRHKYAGLAAMANDPLAYDFITQFWVKTISHDPTKRPTPEDLLSSPWLAGAPAPTNPDWRMWQEPKEEPAEDAQEDAQDDTQEEEEGFQGCVKFCDTCFQDPDPKHTKKGRPLMECGIESENMKAYDPERRFMKMGPASKYCDKSFKTETVGRNKHGKDGQQTYFIWKCGKITEREAAAFDKS